MWATWAAADGNGLRPGRCAHTRRPRPCASSRTFRSPRPWRKHSPQISGPLLSSAHTQGDDKIWYAGKKRTNHWNSQSLTFWLITSEEREGRLCPLSPVPRTASRPWASSSSESGGRSLPLPEWPSSASVMPPNELIVPYCQLLHSFLYF